jgi:hypothetical protein
LILLLITELNISRIRKPLHISTNKAGWNSEDWNRQARTWALWWLTSWRAARRESARRRKISLPRRVVAGRCGSVARLGGVEGLGRGEGKSVATSSHPSGHPRLSQAVMQGAVVVVARSSWALLIRLFG